VFETEVETVNVVEAVVDVEVVEVEAEGVMTKRPGFQLPSSVDWSRTNKSSPLNTSTFTRSQSRKLKSLISSSEHQTVTPAKD